MKEKALEYLNKNYVENINIIEPLMRDRLEILKVSRKGVLAYGKEENIYYISTDSKEEAIIMLEGIGEAELFNVNRQAPLEYIMQKYEFNKYQECYQCAYLRKEKIVIDSDLEIKFASHENLDLIASIYHREDKEDIKKIIARKELVIGYENDKIVGFAGIHTEGSIGLLEVLPEFRGKGYGRALESYVINILLEKGRVPYGHVISDNHISFEMQKRLGLTFAEGFMYWTFKTNE